MSTTYVPLLVVNVLVPRTGMVARTVWSVAIPEKLAEVSVSPVAVQVTLPLTR